jgi:hypothetical protein
MQANKLLDGDTKYVSVNDKEKNMGRWTREEKQKFIDGKFIFSDFSQN